MSYTPDDYYRVRKRVKKVKGCWMFTGCKNQDGYGRIKLKNGSSVVAHKVSYFFWVGKVPIGLELDHTCSRRSCVNPLHLEPVTRKENVVRSFNRKKLS